MRKSGVPNFADEAEKDALDDELEDLLRNSDDMLRSNSNQRSIDFGACPHRLKCRDCGREEFFDFDEIQGKLSFVPRLCPACGNNLRGQFEVMFWNWIASTRNQLKAGAFKSEVTSWGFFVLSIILGCAPTVLLYFGLFADEQYGKAQMTCIALATICLLVAQRSSIQAERKRKKRDSLTLNDFLASEYPFKD